MCMQNCLTVEFWRLNKLDTIGEYCQKINKNPLKKPILMLLDPNNYDLM